MAIRAINRIVATIQMRNGMDDDLDKNQLVAGEWAVSTDKKYVYMCFSPGVVLRMATYEAFEQDMKEIQLILATCQNIQAAVERFMQLAEQHASQAEEWSVVSKSWAVGGTGTRAGENTNNSEYWSQQSRAEADRAKTEADRASAIAGIDIDSELSETSANPVQNKVITNFLSKLKSVAFTGKYSDLTEKLPLINNFLTTKVGVGAADAKTVADLKNQMDSQNTDLTNRISEINGNLHQRTNGKFVLDNGLKICWGNIGYGNPLALDFPMPFTFTPIVIASGSYTKLDTIVQVVRVYDVTTTGCKFANQYISINGSTHEIINTDQSQGIAWIAIGY